MTAALHPPGQAGIALLLMRREIAARLASPWPWAVASLICLIAWAYGAGFVASFATESVLVTTDPLAALNLLVVGVLGLVLGLRLAAGLAWEREHRMLEVLLVGPVSHAAVVAAKFLAELGVLAALIAIHAAYLLLAQPLGAGVIAAPEALALGFLPVHALPMLALGLLAGAAASTVRGAVVVYLAAALALAALEAGGAALAAQPEREISLAAAWARAILSAAAALADPISAAARLADPVRAFALQVPMAPVQTALAAALTLATLALAAAVSRLRGVG
jgi:ABC-type Na+ efflux pump permease subunit